MLRPTLARVLCGLFCALLLPQISFAQTDFQIDVVAALSKAGCNAGACHGNRAGKGGLRLSLRGEDAAFDHAQLTRGFAARRIDRFQPAESLLLQKATAQVAHQGGQRFTTDSPEYRIFFDWIADGASGPVTSAATVMTLRATPPQAVLSADEDHLDLQITAVFSDGAERDVTELAIYESSNLGVAIDRAGRVNRTAFGESTVLARYLQQQVAIPLAFLPPRPGFRWQEPLADNVIDRLVYAKLHKLQIEPSPLCDDTVFVRRAYLDAIGILPTATEARRFAADHRPDKRAALIDALLVRPEFADHWATKWADILRNEEKVMDRTGVVAFHQWIHTSIAEGKPVDQFVRELLTGQGSTYKSPAANYYRANRDPQTRGETTARLFLGVRLACAKCHNHPFDRWTQEDYYGWAACFSGVDYKVIENKRRDKLDKNEFQGEQLVLFQEPDPIKHPDTGRVMTPRLLGADPLDAKSTVERLQTLAQWLTGPTNESFARAQANWIFFHLMGRGLVDPIDDFRATNPAVNPALLDALAAELRAGGFDLRHLVRRIMNSRTYQLSAVPVATNKGDQSNFSRAIVRRLTAEQLLDAQAQVLGTPAHFNGYPLGVRAAQVVGVRKVRFRDEPPAGGDRFLATFGKPERLLACECERSNETTLAQAFTLISGEDLNERIAAPGNRIDRLAQPVKQIEAAIDDLFWAALSRSPTTTEQQAALVRIERSGRRPGLEDLAWALLNSKEFIFRR